MNINRYDQMNIDELTYENMLKIENYILIDVRSPKEFKESMIPNSINIPVLLDEERAIIGLVYKEESKEKAKQLGIEAIAKRLGDINEKINRVSKQYDKIIFLCARGGMRSGSMTSFFKSMGYNTYRVIGGYKSYRKFIIEDFNNVVKDVELITIHGKTGTAKTKILNLLSKVNYDVIDLEALAKNRGSHFGHIGITQDRTQKNFESLLYNSLKNRKNNVIIIEGESRKIGPIHIPEPFWILMKSGKKILIDAPVEMRLDVIIDDYTGVLDLEKKLIEVITKLKRYMSNDTYNSSIELIKADKIREAAHKIMVDYYDPMYNKSLQNHHYYTTIKINSVLEGVEKIENLLTKLSL